MNKPLNHYYDFITKKSKNEYIVNFPIPVKINIGKLNEVQAINVTSMIFSSSYLFLDDLRNDFKSGRIKYKQITIKKINSDKLKRKKNINNINNDIKNDDSINNTSLELISSPNNFNSTTCGLYNPYDQYGTNIKTDYLELLSENVGYNPIILKDIHKDSNFEINTLIQYVNIILNKLNTIEYTNDSGELISNIIKIDSNDKNKTQYVNLDIEDNKHYKELQMITEENNLIIGRTFAEHITKRGVEYVLHGQYSEYKLLPNKMKEPRNMLVFDNGELVGNIEGNRDPISEVLYRATNYDSNIVKTYFIEKYKNKTITDIDNYGTNLSDKFLLF